MPEWKHKLSEFQKEIGYKFSDNDLLEAALTHASMNVQKPNLNNYEKLEFLGDRVLGLVMATVLYERFSHETEGEMARRHAGLVCGASLHRVAKTMCIGKVIRMTSSEENTGGRENATIMEDALEALIGAVYLDSGLVAADKLIRHYWLPLLSSVREAPKDAKSALQEWAQQHGFPLPSYHVLSRTGADHAPIFSIEAVLVGSNFRAEATGTSKKEAEQGAAAALLAVLEQ